MFTKQHILTAFCVALIGSAFFEPMTVIGSPPVPVEPVVGCVKKGSILIQDVVTDQVIPIEEYRKQGNQ